jgi:hypothetical protein
VRKGFRKARKVSLRALRFLFLYGLCVKLLIAETKMLKVTYLRFKVYKFRKFKTVKKLLFILLFIPLLAYSQEEGLFTPIPQKKEVSKFLELGVSPLSYKGDLSRGYEKWTSAFNLGLKRNNKKTWNGHFNLMVGSVTGQNINYTFESSATPNNFFKATLVSLNYDLQYNIIKKDNFILYVSQGIGLMRFITRDEDNNDFADQFSTRAKNETYNNITLILPHHIGIIYLFKNNYGAGFQLGRLTPTTDYLDNISQLSSYKKPDNIFAFRFSFYAPLSYKEQKEIKQAD